MAAINVSVTNTFDEWRQKTNELSTLIGDVGTHLPIVIDSVTYTTVLQAINSLKDGNNVRSNWDELVEENDAFILNKPDINSMIEAASVLPDWEETDAESGAFIQNKPQIDNLPYNLIQFGEGNGNNVVLRFNAPDAGDQAGYITSDWRDANSGTPQSGYSFKFTADNPLTASPSPLSCNIVLPDGYFVGTATQALYADLAEKYTTDAEYEVGTVLCIGGTEEVTQCDHEDDHKVIGVVSENPAYLMNKDLESDHVVDVALTGRVMCKVTGTVMKGDLLVSGGNGQAKASNNPSIGTLIGKALEDSDGNGLIEIVIGKV